MKEIKLLSKSARKNPYYLAAFGSASAEERCGRSCSRPATALKKARRKLYNELLETEKGFCGLQDLVKHSPNYSDKLKQHLKCISESSDDEDEGYHPRKPLFPTALLKETIAGRCREHKVPDIVIWKDRDTSEKEECYPMYSENQRNARGK